MWVAGVCPFFFLVNMTYMPKLAWTDALWRQPPLWALPRILAVLPLNFMILMKEWHDDQQTRPPGQKPYQSLPHASGPPWYQSRKRDIVDRLCGLGDRENPSFWCRAKHGYWWRRLHRVLLHGILCSYRIILSTSLTFPHFMAPPFSNFSVVSNFHNYTYILREK